MPAMDTANPPPTNPESTDFDVVVIGAGYGGAAAAALLADQGKRVALVDRTPRAGGKTQTLHRDGCRFEMFGAVGIPALDSLFHELVERLGIGDRVEMFLPEGKIAAVHYQPPEGGWRTLRTALQQTGTEEELAELARVFGTDEAGITRLGEFYMHILGLTDEELDALDDVGFLDFLTPFDLPPGLASQILATCNMLFVVGVDRLAASEALLVLRNMVLGGSGRFHRGGFAKVAEVCADLVAERGGVWLPSTPVRRILVEDGRAVGVATDKGELRAPVVISNAGIQPTVLELVGAEHFPADYVEKVSDLEPSWSIAGIRFVLDARVFDSALIPIFSDRSWLDSARMAEVEAGEIPDLPLIAIDVASELDPTMVDDPDHQVANIQVFVSADPAGDNGAPLVQRAREVIDELYPELKNHIVKTEPYGPRQISRMTRDSAVPGAGGEAVGLAQVVGQVGRHKPDARTPLPGLWLVGCDAGGRGSGTHQAVDSAFRVVARITEEA
jgi:prolycopene isomerase